MVQARAANKKLCFKSVAWRSTVYNRIYMVVTGIQHIMYLSNGGVLRQTFCMASRERPSCAMLPVGYFIIAQHGRRCRRMGSKQAKFFFGLARGKCFMRIGPRDVVCMYLNFWSECGVGARRKKVMNL